MTSDLDRRDPRPLTSREISKMLSSIIAGVVVFDEDARRSVPHVIAAVSRAARASFSAPARRRHFIPDASWAVALSATVEGLRGWCAPDDIATAIAWVSEHLHEICPPTPSAQLSN